MYSLQPSKLYMKDEEHFLHKKYSSSLNVIYLNYFYVLFYISSMLNTYLQISLCLVSSFNFPTTSTIPGRLPCCCHHIDISILKGFFQDKEIVFGFLVQKKMSIHEFEFLPINTRYIYIYIYIFFFIKYVASCFLLQVQF